MELVEVLLGVAVSALALLVGGVGGYSLGRSKMKKKVERAENFAKNQEEETKARAREIQEQAKRDAERILNDARNDSERIIKDADLKAKDEFIKRRESFEKETEQARHDLRERERKIEKRENTIEQRHKEILKKERALEAGQKKLAERKEYFEAKTKELEETLEKEKSLLHSISGLTREQAERMLLTKLEQELTAQFAERIQYYEEKLKAESEAKAREILATSLQRYAAAHTAETTVSTVDIPSDDMKGRIIGREGRNIRTFEKFTGVDVIIDDTPGVVIVSAFDTVRREVARMSLVRLIQDGRIHPSRIEEIVNECQREMDKSIMEAGRAALAEADVGPMHDKLVQLLGRLKFRTSYSQNVLNHSLEVCHLTGMMAAELGLDARLARRCALLHDVGKAADHEMEGGHPKIGAELARRYGETREEVLHAIEGHHDDISVDHIYTVLVAAADAISASRPGARRETLEKYIRRLKELEAIATQFPGVDQAFAIQAGRELRVIANSQRTTDADATKICHDIARAIEEQLDYPGEIKVTVLRESRIVEYAK